MSQKRSCFFIPVLFVISASAQNELLRTWYDQPAGQWEETLPQIIRELLGHVITAAQMLGVDQKLRDSLSASLARLPPPGRVAPDGRLMEWMEDYKETEPRHRCISHLYGLYPADLITPETTPELTEACKKTLEARGDDEPAFSIAYKILWWARLHDGNRAFKLFFQMINPTLATFINYGDGGGIYPNLLSAGHRIVSPVSRKIKVKINGEQKEILCSAI